MWAPLGAPISALLIPLDSPSLSCPLWPLLLFFLESKILHRSCCAFHLAFSLRFCVFLKLPVANAFSLCLRNPVPHLDFSVKEHVWTAHSISADLVGFRKTACVVCLSARFCLVSVGLFEPVRLPVYRGSVPSSVVCWRTCLLTHLLTFARAKGDMVQSKEACAACRG